MLLQRLLYLVPIKHSFLLLIKIFSCVGMRKKCLFVCHPPLFVFCSDGYLLLFGNMVT